MLRAYVREILCHKPDRSTLPSGVRGRGAVRFGLPSGVRGMPGVGCFTHCAASGVLSADKMIANTMGFICYLLRTTDLDPFMRKTFQSEHQFQPKLNLAGTRGCARDFARRGTDAIARKDDRVRKTEVCSVGKVKGFGPEQNSRPFRDCGGL